LRRSGCFEFYGKSWNITLVSAAGVRVGCVRFVGFAVKILSQFASRRADLGRGNWYGVYFGFCFVWTHNQFYVEALDRCHNDFWRIYLLGGDKMMKKHFVTFLSPGTFVSEQTQKSIGSWDVEKAVEMAKDIKERYGATPYGFFFSTRERKDDELDSKVTKRSGTFYLGGKVLTLEDIKARHDPKDSILISNMEGNDWDKVIENCNSWKIVLPIEKKDKVLDYDAKTGIFSKHITSGRRKLNLK
jgi:hypothetical protein